MIPATNDINFSPEENDNVWFVLIWYDSLIWIIKFMSLLIRLVYLWDLCQRQKLLFFNFRFDNDSPAFLRCVPSFRALTASMNARSLSFCKREKKFINFLLFALKLSSILKNFSFLLPSSICNEKQQTSWGFEECSYSSSQYPSTLRREHHQHNPLPWLNNSSSRFSLLSLLENHVLSSSWLSKISHDAIHNLKESLTLWSMNCALKPDFLQQFQRILDIVVICFSR